MTSSGRFLCNSYGWVVMMIVSTVAAKTTRSTTTSSLQVYSQRWYVDCWDGVAEIDFSNWSVTSMVSHQSPRRPCALLYALFDNIGVGFGDNVGGAVEPVGIGTTKILGMVQSLPPPPALRPLIVSNLCCYACYYCCTCHAIMTHCTTPHPPLIHLLPIHIGILLFYYFFNVNMWKHKTLFLFNGEDKSEEDSDDDTEDNNQPYQHLEIYGLQTSTNGQSCSWHTCCGSQVKVGDILQIKSTIIQTDEGVKPALSCIAIKDGSETCQVGFNPHFLIDSPLI